MLEFKNEKHPIEGNVILENALKILRVYPNGVYLYDRTMGGVTDDGNGFTVNVGSIQHSWMMNICNELYPTHNDDEDPIKTISINKIDDTSIVVEWDLDENDTDYLEGNEYYLDPNDKEHHLCLPFNYPISTLKQLMPWFPKRLYYIRNMNSDALQCQSNVYHELRNLNSETIINAAHEHMDMLKVLSDELCRVLEISAFELVPKDDSTYKFICDKGTLILTTE